MTDIKLDWSCDSDYLRSTCGAYELLYWERQDEGSASGRRPAGALPCNSQAVGEAALEAT